MKRFFFFLALPSTLKSSRRRLYKSLMRNICVPVPQELYVFGKWMNVGEMFLAKKEEPLRYLLSYVMLRERCKACIYWNILLNGSVLIYSIKHFQQEKSFDVIVALIANSITKAKRNILRKLIDFFFCFSSIVGFDILLCGLVLNIFPDNFVENVCYVYIYDWMCVFWWVKKNYCISGRYIYLAMRCHLSNLKFDHEPVIDFVFRFFFWCFRCEIILDIMKITFFNKEIVELKRKLDISIKCNEWII